MNRNRKFKISLIVILITFGIGVSAWLFYNSSYIQPTKLILPKDSFDELVSKMIAELTEPAEMTPLREMNLPMDDIEIRYWYLPSFSPGEGIVLRKTDGFWRAYYLKGNKKQNSNNKENKLTQKIYVKQYFGKPESGWKSFTKKVFDAGLLTLKDGHEDDSCETAFNALDGTVLFVEIYKEKTYRLYKQPIDDSSECIETQKMQIINKIIEKEFQPFQKN